MTFSLIEIVLGSYTLKGVKLDDIGVGYELHVVVRPAGKDACVEIDREVQVHVGCLDLLSVAVGRVIGQGVT